MPTLLENGVTQSRYYTGADGKEPPGNCFQACLATVLSLPLDEVPDELDVWKPGMRARDSWRHYWKDVEAFLQDRGLAPLELELTSACPKLLNILSGPSPRNPIVDHSVVAIGEDVAWDPHPTRQGVLPGNHTHMFIVRNSYADAKQA